MPHASWLMPHASCLMAHGSWLMAHGSWLMAHGSWLMAILSSLHDCDPPILISGLSVLNITEYRIEF